MSGYKDLCYCHLYAFPHRQGGGRCAGPGEFICSACGNATESKRVDVGNGGEGAYMVDASACCEAELWPNQPHERGLVKWKKLSI